MQSSLLSTVEPNPFFLHVVERDLLAELLRDKRSPNTRRAYAKDLKDFFLHISGKEPTPDLVASFLKLERFTAIGLVQHYKAHLIDRKLAEATVNRRLAAIKSLVVYAQKCGKCEWSLEEINGEKVQAYRDTKGVPTDSFKLILAQPDRTTLKGKRDYAMLQLLWANALRRNEVVQTNIEDFDPTTRTLAIYGKGRGTQQETINLTQETTSAIGAWLVARGEVAPTAPLFIAVDRASFGQRLSGDGLYHIVRAAAAAAGISKVMSPHRCRHSAITAALDLTNGDVRKVQQLSRHAKVETVLTYWDNANSAQSELTELLGQAMTGKEP